MKYETYANLNEKGARELGYIFTDAIVPIKEIAKAKIRLGEGKEFEEIYRIDIEQLTKEELEMCAEYISRKLGKPYTKEKVIKGLEIQTFIPLRTDMTRSVVESRMQFFM